MDSIYDISQLFIPVSLYYLMTKIDGLISLRNYIGPTEAVSQFGEYFLYLFMGMIISNIFSPMLKRFPSLNKSIKKIIYQILLYPVDYFFYAFSVLFLSLINPLVRNYNYILLFLFLASIMQTVTRRIIRMPNKDFQSEVVREYMIRDLSYVMGLFIAGLFIN